MEEYCLRAGDTQALILPEKGGTVKSLCRGGREFLYIDEENLASAERPRCGVPFLFPICGRLAPGSDTWEGRRWTMGIHGFGHTSRWETVDGGRTHLTLRLCADGDTRAQYPFEFCVELHYRLEPGRLHIRPLYRNTGPEAMPFAYGFHPYFAVDDPAGAYTEVRAAAQIDFIRGPQAFGAGRVRLSFPPQAPEAGACFAGAQSPAVLTDEAGGRRVSVCFDEGFTQLVLWAVRGKGFLCAEPWSNAASGPDVGRFRLLAPGQTHEAAFSIGVEALPKKDTAGKAAR